MNFFPGHGNDSLRPLHLIIIFRIQPPPGGTAILPEYIHYYG
jgi:hypothetical protein